MKKNNFIGVLLIAIIILLVGVIGVYLSNNEDVNPLETKTTETNQNEFNEKEEKETLKQNIKTIEATLSYLAILTSIDNYNASGDYITKKNTNLLEKTTDKQLFIMEQIVREEENNKYFVILNTNGEVDEEEVFPTNDGTTAYYPYDLFKEEYQKYFKDDFNINEREISDFKNSYDTNKDYIYYENRRSGMNGLTPATITIEKIDLENSNQYKANIALNYNERATELLGIDSDQAELVYQRENNNIQLISYILKSQ